MRSIKFIHIGSINTITIILFLFLEYLLSTSASGDLGATSFIILKRIMLPLSLPGIVSGITMVFVPSMSEFVIADIGRLVYKGAAI